MAIGIWLRALNIAPNAEASHIQPFGNSENLFVGREKIGGGGDLAS